MMIYLVNEDLRYSGEEVIKAFKFKSNANEFKRKYELAKKCEPRFPSIQSKINLEDYSKAYSAWLAIHPAPDNTYGDGCTITTVDYNDH